MRSLKREVTKGLFKTLSILGEGFFRTLNKNKIYDLNRLDKKALKLKNLKVHIGALMQKNIAKKLY